MTTRFSLAELADMLSTSVTNIRAAITELSEQEVLTKETFEYGERNWRIAPSDIKKIQEWVTRAQAAGLLTREMKTPRLKRKQVIPSPNHVLPRSDG